MAKKCIYYGWWVLASSVVIIYLSGTALFGFPVYYPSFISTFGWSRAQLLFGNTVLQWAFGGMGLVWGAVADRRGARLVLSIGSACVAVAYLLFARIDTLWHLYAIAFIFGSGLSAMGYLSNQILQARWFVRRRGLAIGLVNSASSLGGSVAPILVTFLIARFGWRGAMGLMDILFWTLPFLLILFVVKEHPEDLGLFPDGAESAATTNELLRRKLPLAAAVESFRGIFRTPVFWVVMGSVFIAAGTIGTTLHTLILYLRDSGFSQQVAASALSLELAISFIGRLGFGALSDHFSPRKIGAVSFMLLALSSVLLFVVRSRGVLLAFAVLHGLGHGAIVSFFPLVLAEAFGTGRHIGRLLAMGHLAYSGGLGTIPIIAGYAFDKTGSFGIGFAINSITTWLAALALLAIGWYWRRPVPTKNSI